VKSWLKWKVLIAVSVQAFGQTVSPNLLTEFDLRAFGLQVPKKGEVSAHDMLILFLSEDRLLLLDQGQPTILDVSHGTARRAGVSDIPEWFAPDGNAGHGLLFNLRMRDYFYAGGEKSPDALYACRSYWPMGIVNGQSILCLRPQHHEPIIVDYSGSERYHLKLHGLPWNPHFVPSARGEKFGLEWSSNSWIQLLDPLACIDSCPTPTIEQFMVFSSSDGRLLAAFRWDPRPCNLYVVPALSPGGTRAAFVKNDRIVVYSLE